MSIGSISRHVMVTMASLTPGGSALFATSVAPAYAGSFGGLAFGLIGEETATAESQISNSVYPTTQRITLSRPSCPLFLLARRGPLTLKPSFMDQGDHVGALLIFKALDGYGKSAMFETVLSEILYGQALAILDGGDVQGSHDAFVALEDLRYARLLASRQTATHNAVCAAMDLNLQPREAFSPSCAVSPGIARVGAPQVSFERIDYVEAQE